MGVAGGRCAGYPMEGLMSETDDEDGAHHVIGEITGAIQDIGYTIPGQAWTY